MAEGVTCTVNGEDERAGTDGHRAEGSGSEYSITASMVGWDQDSLSASSLASYRQQDVLFTCDTVALTAKSYAVDVEDDE